MKQHFRKLRLLSGIFDFDKFYDIAFDTREINLQGKFSSELVKQLEYFKYFFSVDTNTGFLKYFRSDIVVTLT